jgi:hypothetical protein
MAATRSPAGHEKDCTPDASSRIGADEMIAL